MGLNKLPPELIINIATFMFPFDVLRLSHTSGLFKSALESEVLNIRQGFEAMAEVNQDDFGQSDIILYDKRETGASFFIRKICIQRPINFYGEDLQFDCVKEVLECFSHNSFVRLYSPDDKDLASALQNPLSVSRKRQFFACKIMSLPSVLRLELRLRPGMVMEFAKFLAKAMAHRQYCFPELKHLQLLYFPEMNYDCDPEINDEYATFHIRGHSWEDVATILDFFPNCDRQLVFEADLTPIAVNESRIGVIAIPAASDCSRTVQADWSFHEIRAFTDEVLGFIHPYINRLQQPQRWTLIDKQPWRQDTRPIFGQNAKVESVRVSTSIEGTLLDRRS